MICFIHFFGMLSAQTKKDFKITGDLSKVATPAKKIMFSYWPDSTLKTDTCIVKNGKYYFAGQITEPQLVYLTVLSGDFDQHNYGSFFLDPGVVEIVSDKIFSHLKVTGSKSQEAYAGWQILLKKDESSLAAVYQQRDSFRLLFEEIKRPEDSISIQEFQKQSTAILRKMMEINITYAKSHLNSPVTMDVIASIWLPEYAKQQEEIFFMMPEAQRQTRIGKELAAKIAVRPGHKAPDFSLPDTTGKMVRLSSFRGKYVLLEFWASWCGPCRAESPYLKDAFTSYGNKGFTIFSVSCDKADTKKAWLEAIHNDGTGQWTQTSSLTGKYNVASLAYGRIDNIPANFLIDPQGNIIAKDLRGEALDKKLKEIFN